MSNIINERSLVWLIGSLLAVSFVLGQPLVVDAAPAVSGATTRPAGGVPVTAPQAVDFMEVQWLGTAFPDQPLEVRVARLEAVVYGQAHPQLPMAQRLKTLATTYAQSHPQGSHPTINSQTAPSQARTPAAPPSTSYAPATQGSAASRPGYPNNRTPYAATKRVPVTQPGQPLPVTTTTQDTTTAPGQSSQYPTVDQMEQQVFSRTYSSDPLETRLSRLETKVFSQERSGASLYDRTEALKAQVLPDQASDVGAASRGGGKGSVTYDEDGTLLSSQPVTLRIANLEQKLLKQVYTQDTEPARLGRLELKVFNQVAPAGVTEVQRVERLEAVASASRTGGPVQTTGWNNTAQMALPFAIMILMMLL